MNPREVQRIGPYNVRRFIAEGGMAWVFEVTDPTFEGRRLALKMLKPEAAAGEEFQRFESEARLLAAIDHPNLVTIFDFGRDGETNNHYYTMTFVEGPTMAERLAEGGPLGAKEAGRLFLDLLDGLDALHKRGIVHRDIKPANVLIDERGRARVADLGIARVQEETSRTRTGMAVGTVIYMSPEQARGKRVGPSSDVFSVGLTLYEALTGRIVYEGVEDVDSTNSHDILGYLVSLGRTGNEIDISYPSETQIPSALQQVIEKACSFHADDRYADAAEMAQALETALQPGQTEVVVTQAPNRSLLIGGGVGVALVAVLAAYVGIYRPMAETARNLEEANRQLELSGALKGAVPLVLDRAKDLDPLPPKALLDSADQLVERAADYLGEGREDFEAELYQPASGFFERAIETYEEACQKLVDGHLAATAKARVADARSRESGLADAGAPTHVPEAWGALTAATARLGPPGVEAPCAVATAELDRIDGAGQALAMMVRTERDLAEVWPRLAESARNEALTAQKLAEAEDAEAREYRSARDAGRAAFAEAEKAEKEGRFLPARDAFGKARELFTTAAAIAPAAKARAEVRRLEQEIASKGTTTLPGSVSVLVSRADGAYGRGEWKQADELYREAVGSIKGALQEGELKSVAMVARTDALTTREVAIREGAEKSATSPLGRADEARDRAAAALEEKRYDEAEREFQNAQKAYAEARDAAIQAMATAREAQVQARRAFEGLGGDGCGALESSTAQQDCRAGQTDLEAGAAALADGDAPTALRSFRTAQEATSRARTAEDKYLVNKPRPPELVKRTPQRAKVAINRNQEQKFGIEARDPNPGDRLSYDWTFQGRPVASDETSLTLRPDEGGVVAVTVSDGRASFTEQWELDVNNRKPRLSLSPTSRSIALEVGGSKQFRATTTDPDGDKVTTVFLLDGKPVAEGESYRFAASRTGAHKLEVVAEDEAGARTVLARTISVVKKAAPPPPSQRPPSPPPVAEATWESGVRTALAAYERAINAKSMAELEQVWLLPADSLYRTRWTSKFKRPESLDVSVEILSMDKRGQQVRVVFNQREATPSKTRTWKYEATLVKRSTTDEWQIVENKLKR